MNYKIRDVEITLKPESNKLIPCYNWFIGVLSNNTWEPKTFEIFDECSDTKATALDIGSWIGATSIFLSKKFKNVIAVEADKNAIAALERNIMDNNCSNIKVLEAAVYNDSLNKVFFGKNKSTGDGLGNSMSQGRTSPISNDDYEIKTITLKNIIRENNTLDIKFVKVDIEGGEENIIDDLFLLGHDFGWKVFISFHYTWWLNPDLSRFEKNLHLLKNVKFDNITIKPNELFKYVQNNHFGSFYLEF